MTDLKQQEQDDERDQRQVRSVMVALVSTLAKLEQQHRVPAHVILEAAAKAAAVYAIEKFGERHDAAELFDEIAAGLRQPDPPKFAVVN